MIHPYVWHYKKVFTGANGKRYILDGVLAVKSCIDPARIIEQWNRAYWANQENPYTLGESITKEQAKLIVDNNGRSLYDASSNHHMNQYCAIVVKLTEIAEV